MSDWNEEQDIIRKRSREWRDARRETAREMYATASGKAFLHYLLEDLRFFDPVVSDAEITMHNFAVDMLREYFGVLVDNDSHRSFVLDAIMRAWKPEGDNE